MSRSDNTMPLHIQEQDGKVPTWTAGGSYRGIHEAARRENKRRRRRAKLAVKGGREPSTDQHRHSVKYDWW